MKEEWLDHCYELSLRQPHFFSGARKILRNVTLEFTDFGDDLTIGDSGFTKSKLTMLRRLYTHEESLESSVALWSRRCSQRKYGSVGFHCFNHTTKSDPEKKSKRASVMGPCIQSVALTYMPDHSTEIDLYYRTTEFFKKFPADLVFLRDEIFSRFDFSAAPVKVYRFHFANLTLHPMYFVTVIPHLGEDVFDVLDEIKEADRRYFDWTVKWTARYLIAEYHRGIQKFAQAMRVSKDANERIPADLVEPLKEYLQSNHPGYRGEYEDGDDDESDD